MFSINKIKRKTLLFTVIQTVVLLVLVSCSGAALENQFTAPDVDLVEREFPTSQIPVERLETPLMKTCPKGLGRGV